MGLIDNVSNAVRNWILSPLYSQLGITGNERTRLTTLQQYEDYLRGNQRQQLPVKFNKPNDNLTINLVRKVVDKSVAMLFGGEVEFDLGEEGEGKGERYLAEIWGDNNKPIFLHKLGATGATYGTVYVKLVTDGEGGVRFVSLPPMNMKILTRENDPEIIEGYEQLWLHEGEDGKTKIRRERTERILNGESEAWVITQEEQSSGKQWVQLGAPIAWDYPFPPIVHGQNLPVDDSPYGESDIEGIIGLQDRTNYVASNISKIIRYHAHPKTIAAGMTFGGRKKTVVEGQEADDGMSVEVGGDQMFTTSNNDAKVWNLEMQSDLASSMNYLQFLIQSVYDLSSTVNLSNVKDKLGQLTNFGIRVLYQDALEKLQVKRDMYGELLTEINRRILYLNGDEEATGGVVVWPVDVTPMNTKEQAEEIQLDLTSGILDKQTAAGMRGYDWDTVSERLQKQGEQQQGELGARLIQAFNNGV